MPLLLLEVAERAVDEEDDELLFSLSRTERTTLPLEVEPLRFTVELLPEVVPEPLEVVLRLTLEPLLELPEVVLRFTCEELLLLLFERFTCELLELEDELLRFTCELLLLLLFVRFT